MRIGIDAYPLARNGSGTSNYLFNIIKHLEKIDFVNEYYLYSCPGIKVPFIDNAHWHLRIKKGLINKSSTLWMQIFTAHDLKKDKIDIFWAPEQIAPINLPKHIKLVLTVHDLTWFYYPQTVKWYSLIFQRLFFKRSIDRADIVLVESKTTTDDLKKDFNDVNFEKIKVIYLGRSEDFKALDHQKAFINICKKFNIFKKYILCVGTVEPRKNIETLIKAYSLLGDNIKKEYQVLIVGKIGWGNSRLFKLYKQSRLDENHVKFLGYVLKEDLINLYCGASLFVFPSLYEGFGLPLLEAMTCGVPIVCSDIEVFREIADKGALFVNSREAKLLSLAIHKTLNDQEIRHELVEKGLSRSKVFSWHKVAQDFLDIFNTI